MKKRKEEAKKIINAENPTDEMILAFKDYDINTVLKVCARLTNFNRSARNSGSNQKGKCDAQ